MSKEIIFYFDFSFNHIVDEDANPISHTHGFIVSSKGVEKIGDVNSFIQGKQFTDMVNQLEHDYGIHDWSTSPSDSLESIGYCSYEVSKDKVDELMNKWRDFFVQYTNEEVSNVVSLGQLNAMEDVEIHKALKEHIAQQDYSEEIAYFEKQQKKAIAKFKEKFPNGAIIESGEFLE